MGAEPVQVAVHQRNLRLNDVRGQGGRHSPRFHLQCELTGGFYPGPGGGGRG